jgi:thioredoxin reductase (NADPH)
MCLQTADQKIIMNDVIIIGAGAAGLSAGLWCDELGLKTLVLESEKEIGGQLLRVYNPIANHLGAIASNGSEMRDKFAAQIENCGFQRRFETKISSVDLAAKNIVLENGEQLRSRAIILATGVRRRRLNIAGENLRGVLESGKRDAEFGRGKNVCVIGGGDAAAENALIFAAVAEKVFLVHRNKEFRARAEFLEKINGNTRIEILLETEVKKIVGKEAVEAVELRKNDSPEKFQIAVSSVLVRIGVEPNTDFVCGQIKLDENGYIEINSSCETSLENVFAVGDVANPLAPTVSSAVGGGATAAKMLRARFDNNRT